MVQEVVGSNPISHPKTKRPVLLDWAFCMFRSGLEPNGAQTRSARSEMPKGVWDSKPSPLVTPMYRPMVMSRPRTTAMNSGVEMGVANSDALGTEGWSAPGVKNWEP